ncbi:DUF3737 family protein [Ileibacterium valens]|uniref:DUF3737 family protein n=1 Tax=Ileibacterium valens TaxID=1862668 RepID=UPI00259B2878|nr:DUF3737 family protein [Ileibacterium valens]
MEKQVIVNGRFQKERPLYRARNLELKDCIFNEGESPLKEGKNLCLDHIQFRWKYPLWCFSNVCISKSIWEEMGRSGFWYTNDMRVSDCLIEAAKNFRRCERLVIEDTELLNAQETLWSCQDITLRNVSARGDYFGINSKRGTISNLHLCGNYCFDGAKDLVITDSVLLSKDAFWNTENVTVKDSVITGEYLGWNSKNLTFINCTISSDQGLCYAENLVLENCTLLDTSLAFEYSCVNAKVNGSIDSVKNPCCGRIECDEIRELIMDDTIINPGYTEIIERNKN